MCDSESSGLQTTLDLLDRIVVVDTSLRNWDVPCGCTIPPDLKLRTARVLADARVDVIEAGMPARSASSFGTVSMVAREVHGPIVSGLSSCSRPAIELTGKALKAAHYPRIHVVLSAAFVHVSGSSIEEELLGPAAEGVRIARDLASDVEFSASDFLSADWAFMAEVLETALEEGASTVNVSDSSGRMVPEEASELVTYLRRYVRGIQRARLSVRCGNQFGIATANSLAAIFAGARQVVCALTETPGTGSGSLQELISVLEMRKAFFQVTTGVHLENLLSVRSGPRDLLELIEQYQPSSRLRGTAVSA